MIQNVVNFVSANPYILVGVFVLFMVFGALRKDKNAMERFKYWWDNKDPLMRLPVKLMPVKPGDPIVLKRTRSGKHTTGCAILFGVFVLLIYGCLAGWFMMMPWQFDVYAQAQAATAKAPTFTPTATRTPTLVPTWTVQPTYTPFSTWTPPPPTATSTQPPPATPVHTWTPLPTYTPFDFPTQTATRLPTTPPLPTATVEKLTISPLLNPLTDTVTKSLVITVTATVAPTDVPTWNAWHVINMEVRDMADRRDGSTEVRHILLDANGNFTHSLAIKCRMSNADNDLRVNEPKSQKVLIHAGVPGYTFYIGQGGSQWDVQFYRYVSEKQAIDISELLKLPVGKNQLIEVYWEYGACPLVHHAQVNAGAGTDNGRSAPVQSEPVTGGVTVVKTVIVVTATPQPIPTNTPWIIYVPIQVSPTPTRFTYPTWTPAPTYTAFPTETNPAPPTATVVAYPPPLLTPLSNSVQAAARSAWIYLPLMMKGV